MFHKLHKFLYVCALFLHILLINPYVQKESLLKISPTVVDYVYQVWLM